MTLGPRPAGVAPAPLLLPLGRAGPRRPMTTAGPSVSPTGVSEPVSPVVECMSGSGTSATEPGPGGGS
eukprot:101021-Alexandrium_andersonii.AAC.1